MSKGKTVPATIRNSRLSVSATIDYQPDFILPRQRFHRLRETFVTFLAIYGAVVVLALLLVPLRFLPAEDAVILHHYSRNLAIHGAITYLPGGPRTEGATDFGWMVLLAAAMRAGISPGWCTAVLNAAALLLLGLTLVELSGISPTRRRVLAVCGAAGLVPQILAAAAGFAVLTEALLLAAFVLAVARRRTVWAALFALFLCLLRPDGVLFTVPLLGWWLLQPVPGRRRRLIQIAFLFLLPCALYFVGRAVYFHVLLPLPFLVKSDVRRSLGLFVPHSVGQSVKYLLFGGLLFLGVGKLSRPQGRLLALLVTPATLFYWAMRLDQNVGDRFFFFLPLGCALVVALAWPTLSAARRGWVMLVSTFAYLATLFMPFLREIRSFRDFQFQTVQQIAQDLDHLPQRGTLLTSEAGFLAYDCGWPVIDAWGLNTERFARHFIQPSDIVALHPDLVVFHPDFPQGCTAASAFPVSQQRTWTNMVHNLEAGIQLAGGYELWQLSYGSDEYRRPKHWKPGTGDVECFYLKQNTPVYAGTRQALASHGALLDKPLGKGKSQSMHP